MQVACLRKLNKLLCLELIVHEPAIGTQSTCLHAVLPPLLNPNKSQGSPSLSATHAHRACAADGVCTADNSAGSRSGSGSNDPELPYGEATEAPKPDLWHESQRESTPLKQFLSPRKAINVSSGPAI
jgi:hypothetical protein